MDVCECVCVCFGHAISFSILINEYLAIGGICVYGMY